MFYIVFPGNFVRKPFGYDGVLSGTKDGRTISTDNDVVQLHLSTTINRPIYWKSFTHHIW